jgi:hypothetical protein
MRMLGSGSLEICMTSHADDFRSWHETVMPMLSPRFRYEGMSGPSSVAVRGHPSRRAPRSENDPISGSFNGLVYLNERGSIYGAEDFE